MPNRPLDRRLAGLATVKRAHGRAVEAKTSEKTLGFVSPRGHEGPSSHASLTRCFWWIGGNRPLDHPLGKIRRALRAFREVLADEGFDALLAKCFRIISNSRSVSLPKRFNATMTGKP
jgi:hypothetical protein